MNIRTALGYIETELGKIGYKIDLRTDIASPPRSKIYRVIFEDFSPAVSTLGASALSEIVHTMALILQLPESGGRPYETTIQLAEEAAEAIDAVLNIHALYDDPKIDFLGASAYTDDGVTLKVILPFNLSYKRG